MRLLEMFSRTPVVGETQIVFGLGVVPILGGPAETAETVDLLLLEEALATGEARVTETSEGGEVPFLRVDNEGKRPILILEGEELVGGKQNRTVNTSLIVAAETSLKIPVSCMEAGRWQRRRETFESGRAVFRASARRVQKASVMMNLEAGAGYRSDQGAVWDQVSASLREFRVCSPSSDFRASRELLGERIEDYVTAVRPVDEQTGAIFVTAGGVLGMELLGDPELFRRCLNKIVRSFAFEVLNAPPLDGVPSDLAASWWERVLDAPVTVHPSLGLGEDIRLGGSELVGSGLRRGAALVHFSCFPSLGEASGGNRLGTRRLSASLRRARMLNERS